MKKTIISLAVLNFLAWGCEKDPITEPEDFVPVVPEEQAEVLFEFTDIDNNIYHAIEIGKQIWSQENLKTTHYNDGTPIVSAQDLAEWEKLTSGGYCCYDHDAAISKHYGLLYNYYAAASGILAPEGWHIATYEDWILLLADINNNAGNVADKKDWKEAYTPFGNKTGFTALPNGYRSITEYNLWGSPDFGGVGLLASWWSSDGNIMLMLNGSEGFYFSDNNLLTDGYGIRLVKDADDSVNDDTGDQGQVSGSSEFKDIDGNVYPAIKIGDQIWSMENLKTTHYNDGTPIYMGTGDIAGETNWFDLRSGAYCWYNNDAANKSLGAIYNWFAIETGKLAPEGWHVPTEAEWRTLINYLGGETPAHTKLTSSGTNESGFSAVSSPILCGWGFLTERSFWSATPYQNSNYSVPYANYFSIWEENSVGKVKLFSEPQSYGFCVRCLKNI